MESVLSVTMYTRYNVQLRHSTRLKVAPLDTNGLFGFRTLVADFQFWASIVADFSIWTLVADFQY